MYRAFAVLLLLCVSPLFAQGLSLTEAQWAASRSSAKLVRLPGFGDLMAVYERQSDGALVVRHGNGDARRVQAEDLKTALVALGVPGDRVRLERDGGLSDRMEIEAVSGARQ